MHYFISNIVLREGNYFNILFTFLTTYPTVLMLNYVVCCEIKLSIFCLRLLPRFGVRQLAPKQWTNKSVQQCGSGRSFPIFSESSEFTKQN